MFVVVDCLPNVNVWAMFCLLFLCCIHHSIKVYKCQVQNNENSSDLVSKADYLVGIILFINTLK